MILYYLAQKISQVPFISVGEGDAELECATVVLQHADGAVGFERYAGAEAMRAIVGDVVAIECANAPRWVKMAQRSLSSQSLHSQFRRAMTCSETSSELLRALDAVFLNGAIIKKNQILTSHGKPALAVALTMFDDWILPDGRVRARALTEIVRSARHVAFWAFADWGLHARIIAGTLADAIGPIVHAGLMLGIPVKQIFTEAELPTW